MSEARLSRGTIYYEMYGKGELLIGLHHGMGSCRTWAEQTSAFAKHFAFLVYDRLGHGRSERHLPYEKGYFEHRASELGELITGFGFDAMHLCGMCEGGAVALVFASSWPERVKTLILQGVGYYGNDQTIAKCEEYFQPWTKLSESLRHRLMRDHGEDYAPLKWEALRETKPYVWSPSYDLRSMFSSVEAPTLIIGGDRDPFFGLEHPIAAYRGIKNSELCVLPRAGHFLNEETPTLFNKVALDFLGRHVARPG